MSLNFEFYFTEVITYFQHNIYIGISLASVLILLMLKKPRLFFTLLLIAAINISLLFVISYTSSLGESQKKNLINKTELHVRAY